METNGKNPYAQSFEYARDAVKQLLTLSATIIGVSIAFLKDIFRIHSNFSKILVTVTWSFFDLSIFFGVMALFAITANVAEIERRITINEDLSKIKGITSASILQKARLQALTFVLGILLVVMTCVVQILCV